MRKYHKGGSFPKEKYDTAVEYLCAGKSLPLAYRDHQLRGALAIYREFHIAGNLLVLYKRNNELRVITIAKIGTHGELFGE